jgi:hypothetical protein
MVDLAIAVVTTMSPTPEGEAISERISASNNEFTALAGNFTNSFFLFVFPDLGSTHSSVVYGKGFHN